MSRFHWHIEQGLGAYVSQEGISTHKDSNVQHVTCEIETPGQESTAVAQFTLPHTCFQQEGTREVGIILAHGDNAEEWKGKLLCELSVTLAEAGFVVMRYYCKQKEQRRYRIFEKALDACATSPYARCVTRWILGGIGSGARVAATVGSRCRGQICGFIYLSYPLNERIPSQKGSQSENSVAPLMKLHQPSLFVHTLFDELSPFEELKKYCKDRSSVDVRLLIVRDADSKFKDYQGNGPKRELLIRVGDAMVKFADALNNNSLETCDLPKHDQVNAAAQSESFVSMDLLNHINNDINPAKKVKQDQQLPSSFSQTTAASLLYGQRYVPPALPPTSMSLQSLLERPQVTTGSNSGLGQLQGRSQGWNLGQAQGQGQLSEALQSFGQYLNSQYGMQFQNTRGQLSAQQKQLNQNSENRFAQYYQQWSLHQQQQQQQQQQLRLRYKELWEKEKNKNQEQVEKK
eukprot:TRINITY_DN3028_c0_g1_i1.p1 TRINITY_DN3028_c0_g1~~TRINITY_DN3028_c0_g1_i1.p1  ORF type:complete len:460 (+),score=66.81 TRINITY_DN3028_c0_g1_i1:272-1651(+)